MFEELAHAIEEIRDNSSEAAQQSKWAHSKADNTRDTVVRLESIIKGIQSTITWIFWILVALAFFQFGSNLTLNSKLETLTKTQGK